MASLRLGCDLCQIETIDQMLQEDRGAVERLFTSEERSYAMAQAQPAQHLAGIFAAKEALVKAVRDASVLGKYHRDVTVVHGQDGAPVLSLSEALGQRLHQLGARIVDCSISHDGAYAMAAVLVEWGDRPGSGHLQEATPQAAQVDLAGGTDRLRCHRCLLTLQYLRDQRIADVLVKAQAADGAVVYLCPVCLRGW